MVLPLMAAAFAMQAAGTLEKNRAARSAASATRDALINEDAQQERYRRQAQQSFGQTLAGFTAPEQMTGTARIARSRGAAIGANQTPEMAALPGAGSAPATSKADGARALAHALARGRSFGQRLARMGAHGENQFNNGVALGQGRQDLATISGNAAGSAGVLPYALAAAAEKAQSPFGDLLMGGGQMAGMAGALGYGPSWGDIFGSGGPAYPVSPSVKTGGAL